MPPGSPARLVALDGMTMDVGGDVPVHPRGIIELRRAVADKLRRDHRLEYDPEGEILVTSGVKGGFAASMMALFNRGDEVLVVEPFFGWHIQLIRLAGLSPRFVPLDGPSLALSGEGLRAALGPRTRGMVLCTPSNPGGKVYTRAELELVADIARDRSLLIITDEQYEHACFDGHEHIAPASVADLRRRCVTLMGYNETLSTNNRRIGYAAGPAPLIESLHFIHETLYLGPPAALQQEAADALATAAQGGRDGHRRMRRELQARRDQLCAALRDAGFSITVPQGGFFVLADVSFVTEDGSGDPTGEVAMALLERFGVAAVPGGAFFSDPSHDHVLQFCFSRRQKDLDEMCSRLRQLGGASDPVGPTAGDGSLAAAASPASGRGVSLRPLTSQDDRDAAARLAYDVYVRECRILGDLADHELEMLHAGDDDTAHTIGLFEDGELLGTVSGFCWADAPFPDFYQEVLGIARFDEVAPREQMAVVTRLLVRHDQRGKNLTLQLLGAMWFHVRFRGVTLIFGDCQPQLVSRHESFAMRAFGRPFNYANHTVGVPLVCSVHDHAYALEVKSPLLGFIAPDSDDPDVGDRLARALADRSPTVTPQGDGHGYWQAIDGMLESLPESQLDPFHGFARDEIRRIVERAYILDCDRDLELITRSQTNRTVYVVIDGELEVHHDAGRRLLGPGELCGEIAYLTESERTADVRVSSPRARILSLSEELVRALGEDDPALAARFHGNMARILAHRLTRPPRG